MNKLIPIISLVISIVSVAIGIFALSKNSALNGDIRNFRSEQLYSQALADLNQRDFAEAKNKLKDALEFNPKLKNGNFQLAFISVAEDEKSAAIVYAEKELEIYPDNAQALSLLGTLQIMEKDTISAEKNLKKALELQPSNRDAILNLSHLYRVREQASNAIDVLEKFLALRPDDGLVQFKYQMALIAGGRQSRMVASLQERINSGVATASDYILATAIQLANKEVKQAYTALNEALKKASAREIQGLLQDPFFQDYTNVINNFDNYKKKALEQASKQSGEASDKQ